MSKSEWKDFNSVFHRRQDSWLQPLPSLSIKRKKNRYSDHYHTFLNGSVVIISLYWTYFLSLHKEKLTARKCVQFAKIPRLANDFGSSFEIKLVFWKPSRVQRILVELINFLVEFSCCLVTQSCDSLRPHGLQDTRFPSPPPAPGACSDSCPSSRWCHPTILSFVIVFSSCPQPFPASGSFPKS